MKKQTNIQSFTFGILIICFGIYSNIKAQKINIMKISSIELEHTNPSMGPNETTTKITLYTSESHLETIKAFLYNAKVNNTTSLANYLEAYQTSDIKTINKVMSNAPKGKLNEGQSISNLTFSFEEGEKVTLKDIYRQYSLTLFNPNFSSYMVKNGSKTEQKSEDYPDQEIIQGFDGLDFTTTDESYNDESLIIHLALSPGGPGSNSYQLFVYGDGKCEFTGSSKRDRYSAPKNSINKTSFTKEEIKKILDTAKEIDFIILTQSRRPLPHVDDGQQTSFVIWQDGALRRAEFSYGEYAMNKETKALADYILSLVEG